MGDVTEEELAELERLIASGSAKSKNLVAAMLVLAGANIQGFEDYAASDVEFPNGHYRILDTLCEIALHPALPRLIAAARRPESGEPIKMLVDNEWLRRNIESSPDLDTEAFTPAESGEALIKKAYLYDTMKEVAEANDFESLIEAIAVAVKARETLVPPLSDGEREAPQNGMGIELNAAVGAAVIDMLIERERLTVADVDYGITPDDVLRALKAHPSYEELDADIKWLRTSKIFTGGGHLQAKDREHNARIDRIIAILRAKPEPSAGERERAARIIDPKAFEQSECWPLGQAEALAKVDRIIAILRPAVTGERS